MISISFHPSRGKLAPQAVVDEGLGKKVNFVSTVEKDD